MTKSSDIFYRQYCSDNQYLEEVLKNPEAWISYGNAFTGIPQGQIMYLMETYRVGNTLVGRWEYYNSSTGKWVDVCESTAIIGRGHAPFSKYNCERYGLCASGGSHYSIRKQTVLWEPSQNRARNLYPGQRVIIGKGQGYGYARDNRKYLRCNGYYDSNGNFVETFGGYVYLNPVQSIGNYEINTY